MRSQPAQADSGAIPTTFTMLAAPSMRGRLANHLNGHRNGSKAVGSLLDSKEDNPSGPPDALYVAGFATKEHKSLEKARIKRDDPLLNILGGQSLPPGLTHQDILESEAD